MDDLRAIQEQRETLLRELQQLRDALAESDARMEANRQRVRELQNQQDGTSREQP